MTNKPEQKNTLKEIQHTEEKDKSDYENKDKNKSHQMRT
jgi:hypothetical protein